MKLSWSDEARQQFFRSISGIEKTIMLLRQQKWPLVPEIILQWIEDIYLYTAMEEPCHGVLSTCQKLGIALTQQETHLLQKMEKAIRKEEAYKEFISSVSPDETLNSLIRKIASVQHQQSEGDTC